MGNLEDLRQAEAEREQREAASRRRWEQMDRERTRRDMEDMDFPDEWLEEIESEATK